MNPWGIVLIVAMVSQAIAQVIDPDRFRGAIGWIAAVVATVLLYMR